MSISPNVQKVSFSEALDGITAAIEADLSVMLIGDPGVGKSALARLVARNVNLPLEVLIGSTLDATDVGGLPVVSEKRGVERFPLASIRRAAAEPVLLLLDEVSCSPWPVQAACLRLVFERWAGDEKLHPFTKIILATNPEEQSPGGVPISAPMMGRVVAFYLRPTADEVRGFFSKLGHPEGSAFDRALRREVTEFVYTSAVMPDLLQIDIPTECVGGNTPWGSPRSWERALVARAIVASRDGSDSIKHLVTAGSVGVTTAAAYKAVLDMRDKLPSVDQIERSPATVALPQDKHAQIGAASLVQHVADRNTWASWVYASRLEKELQATCAQILLKRTDSPKNMPHYEAGSKARREILAAIPTVGKASIH